MATGFTVLTFVALGAAIIVAAGLISFGMIAARPHNRHKAPRR